MRRLIEIATERRVTIIMLMTAIVLFGMVSLSRLNLNLLPDISYPTLTIRAELTGAAPVEIENLLTKPIEEAVGVVRNVRLVRSVSRSGQSDVTIEARVVAGAGDIPIRKMPCRVATITRPAPDVALAESGELVAPAAVAIRLGDGWTRTTEVGGIGRGHGQPGPGGTGARRGSITGHPLAGR